MAISYLGFVGAGSSKTAGTTLSFFSSNATTVNDILLIWVAADNLGTVDGNTSEHTGMADNGGTGNVYTKLWEYSYARGAAAGGSTVSAWITKTNTALVSGAQFTATFSNSITAKAMIIHRFSVASGNSMRLVGTPVQAGVTNGTPNVQMLTGLTVSKQYLFSRGMAMEMPSGSSIFPDTTWNPTATASVSNGTSGGGAASNMLVFTQNTIVSASGAIHTPASQTSWTASDHASVIVAIEEYTPTAYDPTDFTMFFGNY